MLVWDNQQAINWFVGIVEGEGSFYRRSETNTRILIPNNDKDIIDACESFLKSINVLFSTYRVKAGTKVGYKIQISGQDSVNLYNKTQHCYECRLDEYQRIMRASETLRSPTVNLYWLIGIWEAEGGFWFGENHKGEIVPGTGMDNTNNKIVIRVVKNLWEHGLSWYSSKCLPEKRKPYDHITISGVKRCKRFLEATRGLWRSKRNVQRSELMLKFCLRRLALPIRSPYTLEDRQMYNQMKQLNS